jgi:hypothetical protein
MAGHNDFVVTRPDGRSHRTGVGGMPMLIDQPMAELADRSIGHQSIG